MKTENTSWDELKKESPEWFRNAKFGLFFHWGPYSVPAYQNEWYSRNMYAKGLPQNLYHEKVYGKLSEFGYKDFLSMWRADQFDPEAWADLVEMSGARYAGPVSEHADNFSMWDSEVNLVNAMHYGPKRDVVGECFKAFRKRGIKTLATFHHQWLWGWFMSTDNEADVYDPANEKFYGPCLPLETNRYLPYRYPDKEFCENWMEKVNEVVDKYSPDVVYFDSRACIIADDYRREVTRHYYGVQEQGIITYKQEDLPEGVGIYDIECGRFAAPKSFIWQTDDRLEDNVTWCIVQEPKYKSPEAIVHQLADVVAKNGNLLLNVGPRQDGSFHPDAVKTLKKVGDWLKRNGEAIYGTRPFVVAAEGPTVFADENYDINKIADQIDKGTAADSSDTRFSELDFRFTTKEGLIYVIAMGWPLDGVYRIKSLGRGKYLDKNIRSIELLGQEGTLDYRQNEDALYVSLREKSSDQEAYVLKICLQI